MRIILHDERENRRAMQYYRGMVGPGEEVRLVREPTNRYDRYVGFVSCALCWLADLMQLKTV